MATSQAASETKLTYYFGKDSTGQYNLFRVEQQGRQTASGG